MQAQQNAVEMRQLNQDLETLIAGYSCGFHQLSRKEALYNLLAKENPFIQSLFTSNLLKNLSF